MRKSRVPMWMVVIVMALLVLCAIVGFMETTNQYVETVTPTYVGRK